MHDKLVAIHRKNQERAENKSESSSTHRVVTATKIAKVPKKQKPQKKLIEKTVEAPKQMVYQPKQQYVEKQIKKPKEVQMKYVIK